MKKTAKSKKVSLEKKHNSTTSFQGSVTIDKMLMKFHDGNMVTIIMMIVALEQAGGPAHFIMPQMKGRVGEQGTGWDIVMIAMGM